MSKILRKLINVPSSVKLAVGNGILSVNGPLGKVDIVLHRSVAVDLTDSVRFYNADNNDDNTAILATLHIRAINAINDVVNNYSESLKMVGVGFKANINNKMLRLFLGFSHDVVVAIPNDINVTINDEVNIVVSGYNRTLVSQFAKFVRNLKSPEPYKGKGIYRNNEVVIRKVGKKK